MMPLTIADKGKEYTIQRIGGNPETRKHLADLGFVAGSKICVVSEAAGNLIVNVKNSRVGIGKDLAMKIMI